MEEGQPKQQRIVRRRFCCWTGKRRKKKTLVGIEEEQEAPRNLDNMAKSDPTQSPSASHITRAPPPRKLVRHDPFHYFGIPLRTPSDYYHFLEELPLRERRRIVGGRGDQQIDGGGHARRGTAVNVLGIGRGAKDGTGRGRKRRGDRKSISPADLPPIYDDDDDDECLTCTCAFPSTSSAITTCQQLPPLFGRLVVQLRKEPTQQLGLGIAGGSDRPIPPTISYLRPGFVAHRCDQLQVGDRLISVNGVDVDTLSHSQVLALLRNTGSDIVELELEYDLNSVLRPADNPGIRKKIVEMELVEEEGGGSGFGFTLRGGAYGPDPTKNRPLTVTAIRTGGAAHREGRLRVGDRLQAINDIRCNECTLASALDIIRTAPPSRLRLSVEYDACVLTSLRRMQGPLLLEIEKVPGVDFGADLAIRHVPIEGGSRRRAVIVNGVVAASIADRCGAVGPGDELLAIDGISLELIGGLAEAYQLLRSQSAVLVLELVPSIEGGINQPTMNTPIAELARIEKRDPLRRLNASLLRLYPPPPAGRPSSSIPTIVGQQSLTQPRRQHQRHPSLPAPDRVGRSQKFGDGLSAEKMAPAGRNQTRHNESNRYHGSQSPRRAESAREGSITARISASPGPMGALCHAESMEVTLDQQEGAQKWTSFGIVLGCQQQQEGSDGMDSSADGLAGVPLVIANIEKGSPAEKCGVLQPGDRVLCINDWQTAEGTLEEAQHLLRACSLSAARSVTLLVEFNVIEPVLPPGPGCLFVVRLAKRGSSLGIVCRSEHKGPSTKGQPLIISDIRMGSVAHRCGSIQPGDRIHSIDQIPMDACSIEEAIRLLQRSAPVVKLCVEKGDGQEQELLDASHQQVTYSVELSRKGQLLGITIASAGGLLDPIVIAQLAPGGLADRTGALHVGDQILAINGESVEGMKVCQVTQMLQTCPDPVSIRLCRSLAPQPTSASGLQMAFFDQSNHGHWRSGTEFYNINHNVGPSMSSDEKENPGTPLKSVDSAMDSLEDSPPADGNQARHGTIKFAHLRPSTSNNFQQGNSVNVDLISGGSDQNSGWDSGLSSTAASGRGPVQHRSGCQAANSGGSERCCNCNLGEQPSACSSTSSTSPQSSAGAKSENNSGGRRDKEDWMQILEALETVGEEEMLRKLEECILSGQASNYYAPATGAKCQQRLLPISSESGGVLSRRFLPNSTNVSTSSRSASSNYANVQRCPLIGVFSSSGITTPADRFSKPSLLASACKLTSMTNGGDSRESTPQGERPKTTNPNSCSSQPGTPVMSNRRLAGLMHNTSFELPPPMPSPRSAPPNGVMSLFEPTDRSNRSDSPSTSALPPKNSTTFISPTSPLPHLRSSSAIPFITSPIADKDEEEEEQGDQFDELTEVFSIQLCRCPLSKSFGFSVCDGGSEQDGGTMCGSSQHQKQGIFVRSITKDGPADRSGRIRPGDRILQINGRSVQFLNCDLALPLLATTERVDLLLLRRRTNG